LLKQLFSRGDANIGVWLRRVFDLGLISLGIALTFLPFNETRSGLIELETVSLQKEALLNPDEINTQFPGVEITDITGPELNPDDYPDLFRVFIKGAVFPIFHFV